MLDEYKHENVDSALGQEGVVTIQRSEFERLCELAQKAENMPSDSETGGGVKNVR